MMWINELQNVTGQLLSFGTAANEHLLSYKIITIIATIIISTHFAPVHFSKIHKKNSIIHIFHVQ